MKKKCYKSLPNSLAKTRISKLVEAKDEAWADFRKLERLGLEEGDYLYDYKLAKAVGYSDALRVMGIVEFDILED
jgi:hypothetical protein